jgi:hypothetical protein
MSKNETLVIKYTVPKEHIEAVKAAAEDFGLGLEDFIHYCIVKYLEHFWLPRAIPISPGIFLHLAREAREHNLTLEAYVNMLLTKHIVKESF